MFEPLMGHGKKSRNKLIYWDERTQFYDNLFNSLKAGSCTTNTVCLKIECNKFHVNMQHATKAKPLICLKNTAVLT